MRCIIGTKYFRFEIICYHLYKYMLARLIYIYNLRTL